jgi:hypothetical protein
VERFCPHVAFGESEIGHQLSFGFSQNGRSRTPVAVDATSRIHRVPFMSRTTNFTIGFTSPLFQYPRSTGDSRFPLWVLSASPNGNQAENFINAVGTNSNLTFGFNGTISDTFNWPDHQT